MSTSRRDQPLLQSAVTKPTFRAIPQKAAT